MTFKEEGSDGENRWRGKVNAMPLQKDICYLTIASSSELQPIVYGHGFMYSCYNIAITILIKA